MNTRRLTIWHLLPLVIASFLAMCAVCFGDIHRDLMSRCPEYGLKQIRSFDRATQAHECTHFVNGELSRKYGHDYCAFYVGNGKAYQVNPPAVSIGQVVRFVPQRIKSSRLHIYFASDRIGRNCLSLLDEWVCYTNDAQCTQELRLADDGGLEAAQDFTTVSDCVVRAIQEHDPQYSHMSKLCEFIASHKARVARLSVVRHSPLANSEAGEQQIADLAPVYRQRNASGSCGHASTCSALRWLQEHSKANHWWSTYRNGENFDRHLSRLRAQGIKYVATSDGDERVLEYAAWSRRGAVVYWPPRHIVNYMGRVGDRIFILDNNHTNRFDTYDYADWVQRWKRNGGCAFVVLSGEVPPPVPLGRRV
jgi:hypothetical protein